MALLTERSWILKQLPAFLRRSQHLILFGSRQAGLGSPSSDWDILCVSSRGVDGPRLRREVPEFGRLDIVFISIERVLSIDWLGSELAGHIAAHGSLLSGNEAWTSKVMQSKNAIAKKKGLLRFRIDAAERYFALLSPPYQHRITTLIRRDLQRLDCLQSGIPVPSSPVLDQYWDEDGHRLHAHLIRIAGGISRRRFQFRDLDRMLPQPTLP